MARHRRGALRFDLVCPNGAALRRLLEGLRITQTQLEKSGATNRKTLSNILNGRQERVSRETLEDITKQLNILRGERGAPIQVEDLIRAEEPSCPRPGTPEHYVRAATGRWKVTISQFPSEGRRGTMVDGGNADYDVELQEDCGKLRGWCQGADPTVIHEHFRLEGDVEILGFIRMDGFRDNAPGATHFFRSVVQVQADGTLEGGYVNFDAEHGAVFVGLMKATRVSETAAADNGPKSSTRVRKKRSKDA